MRREMRRATPNSGMITFLGNWQQGCDSFHSALHHAPVSSRRIMTRRKKDASRLLFSVSHDDRLRLLSRLRLALQLFAFNKLLQFVHIDIQPAQPHFNQLFYFFHLRRLYISPKFQLHVILSLLFFLKAKLNHEQKIRRCTGESQEPPSGG